MRRVTHGRVGFVLALLFAQGLFGADCVDGKTPDCSDPNAKCGPDLDGAVEAAADAPSDGPTEGADAADSGDASSDAADSGDASDAPDGG